jgi:hypothetical protein
MAAADTDILIRALDCLAKDDWPGAHELVQDLESPLAYWIHGLVHKMQGDLDNSRYWYRKAGATAIQWSEQTVAAQIGELQRRLCATARR